MVIMPALFVGHGNPLNAIEDNEFSDEWIKLGKELPKPKAILCISAHWLTRGTWVTAMKNPETLHDFVGFPDELFKVKYNAPGSPEFAGITQETVYSTIVQSDMAWGLDHGTWSVLTRMYPDAGIPVFQLSIDIEKPAHFHYQLGKELSGLRKQGVLIIGSGNIVHNLSKIIRKDEGHDWANEFDQKIKELSSNGQSDNDIKEAVNEAIKKSQEVAAKKLQQMGGGLSGLLGGGMG